MSNQSAQAEKAITSHINVMAARFAGQVYAWNVVNEAIDPKNGDQNGLRAGPIRPEYFDLAFRTARAAAPDALLVYNDYGMELQTPEHELRRNALRGLLNRLQRQGTPIQAVGLQSHLQVKDFRFDETPYRKFLREIAARGLKIIISELDVFDGAAPGDVARRDQIVAGLYDRFLNVALDEPAVCAVVTWGLSDRYTWLTPQTGPWFARRDGLPTRPLPFDAAFQPKPAFFAMVKAFQHAPSRAVG